MQCRVVDCITGADVKPGALGELLIRAPAAMCGYLNNPTATAGMIEPDGWLHTGDLVVQDSEEWFRVADRLKE